MKKGDTIQLTIDPSKGDEAVTIEELLEGGMLRLSHFKKPGKKWYIDIPENTLKDILEKKASK